LSGTKARILCVDDDPAIQELLVWHLQSAGYMALAVATPRDALRIQETQPVDLYILDYQLPEMTGDELALELRRRRPSVHVVMISSDSQIPEKARNSVDCFLTKGVGLWGELTQKVAGLLSSGQTHA
jgi:DNA-binding response OmpR family regulator